jgi:hypothetical protein
MYLEGESTSFFFKKKKQSEKLCQTANNIYVFVEEKKGVHGTIGLNNEFELHFMFFNHSI